MAVNSVTPGITFKPDNISVTTKTNLPLPQFRAGEVLNVNIIEKIAADQYLLSVKGATIRANSSLLLNAGEQIRVRVQSVVPQIVLNLFDAVPKDAAQINAQLIQWRVDPDSFVSLLGRLSEISSLLKSELPGFLRGEAQALLALFSSLVFSSRTRNNPLFVKDFLSRCGLLLESDLAAALAGSETAHREVSSKGNLKAALFKLAAALQEAGQGNFSRTEAAGLASLASFASEALNTIQGRQVAALVYQNNESGLYLQIPLELSKGYGTADIFIKPDDKNAEGKNKFSSCRLVLFLSMDLLGQIVVDASLRAGRITCVLKCEDEKSVQIINAEAEKLKVALSAIGYTVEKIECQKETQLSRKKQEYIDEYLIGSAAIVNEFV